MNTNLYLRRFAKGQVIERISDRLTIEAPRTTWVIMDSEKPVRAANGQIEMFHNKSIATEIFNAYIN